MITKFFLAKSARCPILVHFTKDSGPGDLSGRLLQKGWQVNSIGPVQGLDWIGEQWYPALKRSLRSLANAEPVSVLD